MFGFRIPEPGWDEGGGQGQGSQSRPSCGGAWSGAGVQMSWGAPRKKRGKQPPAKTGVLKVGCQVESTEELKKKKNPGAWASPQTKVI